MTLARNFFLLAAAGGFLLALNSVAQAGARVSKWDCPTGQMKNPLTAICEGPYVGGVIVGAQNYGYPDAGNDRGHRPYRYYTNSYPFHYSHW